MAFDPLLNFETKTFTKWGDIKEKVPFKSYIRRAAKETKADDESAIALFKDAVNDAIENNEPYEKYVNDMSIVQDPVLFKAYWSVVKLHFEQCTNECMGQWVRNRVCLNDKCGKPLCGSCAYRTNGLCLGCDRHHQVAPNGYVRLKKGLFGGQFDEEEKEKSGGWEGVEEEDSEGELLLSSDDEDAKNYDLDVARELQPSDEEEIAAAIAAAEGPEETPPSEEKRSLSDDEEDEKINTNTKTKKRRVIKDEE